MIVSPDIYCTPTESPVEFATISVVGLGYIGLPTAAVFASRKKHVIGVDVNQNDIIIRTFTKSINLDQTYAKKSDLDDLQDDLEELSKDVSDCKILINENASDIMDLQDDVSECKERIDQLKHTLLNNKTTFHLCTLVRWT